MDRNDETDAADREDGWKAWLRKNAVFLAAGFIVVAIVVSACVILVVPGEATVVVRLGAGAAVHWVADADHSFHVPARTGRKDPQVRAELLGALAGWLRRHA